MSKKALPMYIDKEQATALLDQPNVNCPTGLRNRVALELMYRAGLRVSEVVKLKPGHIDWKQGQLTVRNGKGSRDRVVPVTEGTVEWLRRWHEQRPRKAGRFFTTLQGKPLSRRYLWGMVKRCAKKTGLEFEKISPHILRHTYATERLDEGFTIAEVQALLGHSNVSTTSTYLHANPTHLREKVQGQQAAEVRQLAAALAKLPKEQRAALAEALSA